jgi:hypothetical protein
MVRPAGSSRSRSSATDTFEEVFEEPWNMRLRTRRTIGELLRGVLEEVRGHKKFHNL